jgi:hypothetical protein
MIKRNNNQMGGTNNMHEEMHKNIGVIISSEKTSW